MNTREVRKKLATNIDITIYNRSADMYSILAPYALHFASAVLPVDTSSKTFGALVAFSIGNADADADNSFQDLGAVVYIKKRSKRKIRWGAEKCWWTNNAADIETIEIQNNAVINRIEQWQPSICGTYSICSESSTLLFIRCDAISEDGGVPGLKTPASIRARTLALGRSRGRDQNLGYA